MFGACVLLSLVSDVQIIQIPGPPFMRSNKGLFLKSKFFCFSFLFCWPCILLGFLVNHRLDAKFFSMCLFQFSTCFEQPGAHHQENQLYQYNIWYMSLLCRWPVTGYRHRVTYTRCCIDTIDSPDDEHQVDRNM